MSVRIPIDSLAKGLDAEQRRVLELPEKGMVEISKLEDNTWMVSLENGQTNLQAPFVLKPLHEKVLRLLKTHQTPDLIEGRFERLLSGEELSAFEELKNAGRIECFKTNPRFDKGIYRAVQGNALAPKREHARSTTVTVTVHEKPVEEYSLLHDGFMVLRSDGAAKAASFDLAERIKAGEVKGIKSFDGFYYIIENELLQKHTPRILSHLQTTKSLELPQIAHHETVPMVLARIVLEFAKEEGSVIEKKKNLFAYVG